MTSEHFEVVVVGGGQAGLAVGFHLARRNVNFVILDAYSRVGEAWRRRWESLRLFTPARLDGLPGTPFPDRARALPTKDQIANYLESYAGHHKLPIRLGTRVEALSREGNAFVLIAGNRRFEANQVVVATGGHPNPKRPDFAGELDQGILQLHSSDYRDPSQLQDGDVLVVGAGNSGAEIALDAALQHRVWLAGRPTGNVSPVLYSRPSWWLATRLITVNTPIGRKMNMQLRSKGTPLVRIREQDFAAAGITRVPRVEGVEAGKPRLDGGRQLAVKTIVWCTGFKHDYGWIQRPAIVGGHVPPHERGVVPSEPGLHGPAVPVRTQLSAHRWCRQRCRIRRQPDRGHSTESQTNGGVDMSDRPNSTHATSKPCVCNVIKRSGLIWKATGQKNAEGQAEYQCKICGATAWRPV